MPIFVVFCEINTIFIGSDWCYQKCYLEAYLQALLICILFFTKNNEKNLLENLYFIH